jgi:hypothetical protein
MITQDKIIRPFNFATRPILVAGEAYLKWKCKPSFFADLLDYLENGIVISRHDIFAMAKIVDRRPLSEDGKPIGENPDPALFVRMAVGSLRDLLSALPVLLPKIQFCRRNEKRIREYDLVKLLQVTDKLMQRRT